MKPTASPPHADRSTMHEGSIQMWLHCMSVRYRENPRDSCYITATPRCGHGVDQRPRRNLSIRIDFPLLEMRSLRAVSLAMTDTSSDRIQSCPHPPRTRPGRAPESTTVPVPRAVPAPSPPQPHHSGSAEEASSEILHPPLASAVQR